MLSGISRRRIGVAALGLMVTFATRGFTQNKKESQETLQGEWTVVSITFGNLEIKGTDKNPMRVIFHQNRMILSPQYLLDSNWSLKWGSSDSGIKTTSTIEIKNQDLISIFKSNPLSSPMEIDIESTCVAPINKGVDFPLYNAQNKTYDIQKGIYRFNNKELEIFLGSPKGTRPAYFIPGYYWAALRLIREKK